MEKIEKYFIEHRDLLNLSEIERRAGLKKCSLLKAMKKMAAGEQKKFREIEKLVPIYEELTGR